MTQILVIVGFLLSIIMGVWKYFGRKAAEKRKLAKEAGDKLDEAQKNKDKSGRIDAWLRTRWMR